MNKDDNATAAEPSGPKKDSDAWLGAVVWLLILGFVGFLYFVGGQHADLFLDVSDTNPMVARGSVVFEGRPIANGTVHLNVDDARNSRYLLSTSATVTSDGTFHSPDLTLPEDVGDDPTLRITAQFTGLVKDKDGKDTSVKGASTLYLNFTPPISPHSFWICVAVALVFMGSLIVLFTGKMGGMKARLLFSIMYLMTFFSLAVPLTVAVLVTQSQYVLEVMEAAPIGLVKGIAPGVSDAQWLINIGGAVGRQQVYERREPLLSTALLVPPAIASTVTVPEQSAAVEAAAVSSGEGPRDGETPASPGTLAVRGGLAVPFYVVLLAMLGAGINMTRRVPEIQQQYDCSPSDDTRSLAQQALAAMGELVTRRHRAAVTLPANITAEIRRALVENYMYLLSAPFLAVAVYYLLQVVATEVAQPVLVIMAFATGLTSDRIVKTIIDFAETTLKKKDRPQKRKETAQKPNTGNAPEPGGKKERLESASV